MTRKRKERSGGQIGIAKTDRVKRETNTQAVEARKQKRLKKRKGLASGNRTTEEQGKKNRSGGGRKPSDPRVGSKKPIQLVSTPTPQAQPAVVKVKPVKPVVTEPVVPTLSFEQELDQLENDARLSALLVRLDNEEVLSADEQDYVDERVERHQFLLAELGYDDDDFDDEYDEEEWDDEVMAQLDAQSFDQNTDKLSEDELYARFLETEKGLKNKDSES